MALRYSLAIADMFRCRFEREAVGRGRRTVRMDSHLRVRDSRTADSRRMCEFELDDEEAAFAYAEERVRAATTGSQSPTAPAGRGTRGERMLEARDADAAVACYVEAL